MMRKFGMQKVKLCKANLIVSLRIWSIQSNHDKTNKKYTFSEVTCDLSISCVCMLLCYYIIVNFNLCLPFCSI